MVQAGFRGPGLAAVKVPGSFANVAPEIDRYEGVGWFRRSFRVPEQCKGKHVVIHFEGVNYHAKCGSMARWWVRIRMPFWVSICRWGRRLRFDRDNVIVVRVDNTRRRDMIPGGRQGWHPFGGILREVELRVTDLFRIESAGSRRAERDGGISAVQAEVANGAERRIAGRAEVAMLDRKGRTWTFGDRSDRNRCGKVGDRRDHPAIRQTPSLVAPAAGLYTADIRLLSEDKRIDRVSVRFGFRKIEARGAMLYLNGKPVFLTGFNRHEDSPKTDMSPDHELTRKELLQMKEMGCNFIRLCHYPQHPQTIDRCDEIGLLVMCEIPLYMWPGLQEGLENYRGTVESAQRQLTKMIGSVLQPPLGDLLVGQQRVPHAAPGSAGHQRDADPAGQAA